MERMVPIDGVLCSACGEKLFTVLPGGELRESELPDDRLPQDRLTDDRLTDDRLPDDQPPLCPMCRRAAPRFKRAVAYGSYAAELRDLIHLFKYRQVKPAGPHLARMLEQAMANASLDFSGVANTGVAGESHTPADPVLVVPVPLWPGKRRTRGFNQAEELARLLVTSLIRFGRASTRIQLDTASLVRRRETASQTGLTRQQRQANLRGAFAVAHPERVAARTVLIVDDVMTTGTTAGECARVLLKAGAKEVFVATVARATRDVTGGTTAVPLEEGPQGHA